MLAGKTQVPVGTRVRVTKISGTDEDDREVACAYEGIEGELTHPFPGLMVSGVVYLAGVWLDPEMARARGIGLDRLGRASLNLVQGDCFEIV